MKIVKDSVVSIEFTLTDDQGTLIDTTDDKDPLSFIQGRGDIFPGIERAVHGHEMGKHLTVTLPPEEAFGPHQQDLVKQVPREFFKQAKEITPGMQFKTKKEGEEIVVTVIEANDELVTIDANHPLASSSLHFDLVIVDVREAIPEELQSGQIQDLDEIYRREEQHPN